MSQKGEDLVNANKRRQEAFEEGVRAANATNKEIESMVSKYDDPLEQQMFLEGIKKGKQRSK